MAETLTNNRLFDLVRYCRSQLHTDGLITEEEYSSLVFEGGSHAAGSVANLTSYDEMRQNIAALESQLREREAERDTERVKSTKAYLASPAMGTFADLKHSKAGTVLAMLQDGAISRGKCCEVLAELAHGVGFDDIPLPEEIGNHFGEDELPGETVQRLRSEVESLTAQLKAATASPALNAEGLRECPFCGEYPTIQPWHGGKPTKKLISCDNENCRPAPGVTGETKREAIQRWNTRPIAAAPVNTVRLAGDWSGIVQKMDDKIGALRGVLQVIASRTCGSDCKARYMGVGPKDAQTKDNPRPTARCARCIAVDALAAVAAPTHPDSVRLDWLEQNPDAGEPTVIYHPPSDHITWRCDGSTDEFDTIREAIDKAMAAASIGKSEEGG